MTDQFRFVTLHKSPEGYEFAERKGRDSVAFILFDRHTRKVGLRLEYKPPISAWVLGAFGGSIDSGKSPVAIVRQEVQEEAGLDVPIQDIQFAGKFFVSSQMNQFCYLYTVFTEGAMTWNGTHDDALEAKSETVLLESGVSVECWKAQILLNLLPRRSP